MIEIKNESLKKYTTVKIGGRAEILFEPENIEELCELVKNYGMLPIISGGSNLLINDEKIFPKVLYMGKIDSNIVALGNGKYFIGASSRLQKIINTINQDGYGGIEYLYSVPGMLGGAIYMNAGRGSDKKCISDCIIDVHVVNEKGEKLIISREECDFSYRKSLFQNTNYIIVGATLLFSKQDIVDSRRNIEERLATCKQYQDNTKPNFGSTFSVYNVRLMNMIKKWSGFFFAKRKTHFSKKTTNWIVNEGNGTFKEAMLCIRFAEKLHRFFNKNIRIEVQIWD